MSRRIAFAVVAIPAVFGVAWLGGWPLTALLAVAGLLGAREIYDFARLQGIEPLRRLGMVGAALAPVGLATTMFLAGKGPELIRNGYLFLLWFLVLLTVALVRR